MLVKPCSLRLSQPRFAPLLGALGLLASCGGDEGITYYDDVRPIFAGRCTICHNDNRPLGANVARPFAPDDGVVGNESEVCRDNPACNLPSVDVDPGNPDNSFLLLKVDWHGPENFPDACPLPAAAGECMPFRIPPLTDDKPTGEKGEKTIIRDWINAGAGETPQFWEQVQPIFGDQDDYEITFNPDGSVASSVDSDGDGIIGPGKCSFCHYQGTPNPPELSAPGNRVTNVFKADVGVVNVKASFQPRMMRVAPGIPDESFLMKKVEAKETEGGVGSPMPYSFSPLNEQQIGVVRQWIQEGAKNN
jgi:hypothetical protein